uniref:G_PROTEIN_RECEP_F1_2 domain-containing protein n=1 Tax=Strongyloides stercoralis TaxID=6248 RepID=A0AAF5D3Y9_STRER
MNVTMLIMGAVYCVVFLIGFFGNLWVIIILSKVIYKNRSSMSQIFRNISSYILTLSIVDLMVLSMIPLLLGQMFCDSWPFGYFGCKLFWAVENINKILSIGILTIMSFERLMAVYKPFNKRPNNGSINMTASYIKKVTRSILKVSFFHLCCWGPFWIMLLIPVLNRINMIPDINYNYLFICKCITSFLPYINSMGNWYFYAVMNREIRNSTYGIVKRKDIVKIKELGSTVMHKISLRSSNNAYN